jgi:hypothetical protein
MPRNGADVATGQDVLTDSLTTAVLHTRRSIIAAATSASPKSSPQRAQSRPAPKLAAPEPTVSSTRKSGAASPTPRVLARREPREGLITDPTADTVMRAGHMLIAMGTLPQLHALAAALQPAHARRRPPPATGHPRPMVSESPSVSMAAATASA